MEGFNPSERIPEQAVLGVLSGRYLERAFLGNPQIPSQTGTLSLSLCRWVPGAPFGSFFPSVPLRYFVLFLNLTLIIAFVDYAAGCSLLLCRWLLVYFEESSLLFFFLVA